jgi:predicted DCC family thiol-disulfide oxidoreductase YuxK
VLAKPNQDPGLVERLGLTREQVDRAIWTVDPAGRKLTAAAAANRVLEELRWPWPWVAALYRVPPLAWLEEAAYRWVARNRHRL